MLLKLHTGRTSRKGGLWKDQLSAAHSRCRRRRPTSYHRTAIARVTICFLNRVSDAISHKELRSIAQTAVHVDKRA